MAIRTPGRRRPPRGVHLNWDMEVGVLAVGGGGCGLAAAIAAVDAGADAAIVEKQERLGGNTALSTGSVPGAGSRFQAEAGIEDSPERMIADLMDIAGDTQCPELTDLLARESAPLVEWLVDTVDARMSLITDYRHIGHSVPRLHAPRSRRGADLMDDLAKAANSRGIPVATGNRVVRLIAENESVIGVELEDSRGEISRIGAGKTILATNGFAANSALVAEHCPEIAEAEYFGAPGSTGEAILWGAALGADTANMAAYQGYAAVAYPQGSLLSWTAIEKGGFLMGEDGRRFGAEDLGYSGFAARVLAQGKFAFALFNQEICDIASQEEEFAEMLRMGGIKRLDRIEDAEGAFGLPPAALTETLEAYNAAARGKERDAVGRRDFGLAPLGPPFYMARVKPGLFHTQGGLRIDRHARVLRPDGAPIANLFAGGGAAAGISGRQGASGYASGNGLLSALGLGRLAGVTAAMELRGLT